MLDGSECTVLPIQAASPNRGKLAFKRPLSMHTNTHLCLHLCVCVCVFIYHRTATLFKPYLSPVTKKKHRMKKSSFWKHDNRIPKTSKRHNLLLREVVSACVVESKTGCKGVNRHSETRWVFRNPSRQRHERSAERKSLPVTTHQRFSEGPGNDRVREKLLARTFRV